jgi:hypothetical protein
MSILSTFTFTSPTIRAYEGRMGLTISRSLFYVRNAFPRLPSRHCHLDRGYSTALGVIVGDKEASRIRAGDGSREFLLSTFAQEDAPTRGASTVCYGSEHTLQSPPHAARAIDAAQGDGRCRLLLRSVFRSFSTPVHSYVASSFSALLTTAATAALCQYAAHAHTLRNYHARLPTTKK